MTRRWENAVRGSREVRFAASRSLWERLDGFDDRYFLYWEDIDLSHRVLELGGSLRVLSDIEAVHDEGGTHRERVFGRGKSPTYYYYNIRNRLVFAAIHLDDLEFGRWLRASKAMAAEVLLEGGRAQFIWPWKALSAARRGLRDGVSFAQSVRAESSQDDD